MKMKKTQKTMIVLFLAAILITIAAPVSSAKGEKRKNNVPLINPFPGSFEILQKKNVEYASRSLFAGKPRDQIREPDNQMPLDANHRITRAMYGN